MRDVMLNSNTTYKRLKVDFTDKMSQVSAESTGLGFAVKNEVKVLEKKVANWMTTIYVNFNLVI